MTDMGVKFDMAQATAGEEPPRDLKVDLEEAHKAQEVILSLERVGGLA